MEFLKKKASRNAWLWVSTLYYAEGLPYVLVMTVSVIMYKNLGVSNTDIALYTGWLYLPWVIKPFWSPIVDVFRSKRWWIVAMQLLMGAAMAGVAFTLPTSSFFQYSLAFFALLAFSSATHDIAADGFYMLGLPKHEQAFFVGIRSTFYRLAMLTGQGVLVIIVGFLAKQTGNVSFAWLLLFLVLAVFFVISALYHWRMLPKPTADKLKENTDIKTVFKEFIETFILFFKKPRIGFALAFLLLYRLGEAQLGKMAAPFLLDAKEQGGLALSNTEIGFAYGTVGLVALVLGGILGGVMVARKGLKYWLFIMAFAINLPNAVYIFMAYLQPDSLWIINGCIAIEQFGYGFGFTTYMLYMIYLAEGEYKTAHFALATGVMALGMMLPGMFSGAIQEFIGYKYFFIWVLICAIPTFLLLPHLGIKGDFGKK